MTKFKTTYNSQDDILEDFFKPAFREYKNTKICSAYFSSSVLIDLFDEINNQLKNGGTFQLILGEGTSDIEIAKMQALVRGKEGEYIFNKLFKNLSIENIEKYKIIMRHIENGAFTIKVGKTIKSNACFHNKLYLFHNSIFEFGLAASGSLNFTNAGIYENYENLIRRESLESFRESMEEFELLWTNAYEGTSVRPVLEYVSKELKKEIQKVEIISQLPIDEEIIKENIAKRLESMEKLRPYQLEAIAAIKNNNYCGMLEMATGTGKTFTAMGIINDMLFSDQVTNIVYISVPYQHLAEQWGEEITEFFGNEVSVIVCHSDRKNWKPKVKRLLIRKKIKKIVLVFVNKSFFSYINENNIDHESLLLIDEAHNITSKQIDEILPYANFKYRVALSATPDDEFNLERSDNLISYFDGIQYQFSLEEAIKMKFLTPYYYIPKRIELNGDEAQEYLEMEKLIMSSNNMIQKKEYEDIQIEILSQAEKKILQFEKDIKVLNDKKQITNTIVYCSPGKLKNQPSKRFVSQITESIVKTNNTLNVNKITYEEDVNERMEYTKLFAEKRLNILCAIKCLDEGYNIPCIETAFVLYSTKRSREYIQRRGRLLRLSKGKEFAVIYDYLIYLNNEILEFEEKRFKEYASLALNKEELMKEFDDKKRNRNY